MPFGQVPGLKSCVPSVDLWSVQYPHPVHRPWFLVGFLAMLLGFGTLASLIGTHLFDKAPTMGALELVEYLGWGITTLTVTGLAGVLFVVVLRGPPAQARRHVVSEEVPLLVAMLGATVFLTSAEIQFYRAITEEMTDSPVVVMIVMALFGLVWLLCASVAVAAAGTLIVRGRSRLELLDNPLAPAQPSLPCSRSRTHTTRRRR